MRLPFRVTFYFYYEKTNICRTVQRKCFFSERATETRATLGDRSIWPLLILGRRSILGEAERQRNKYLQSRNGAYVGNQVVYNMPGIAPGPDLSAMYQLFCLFCSYFARKRFRKTKNKSNNKTKTMFRSGPV